MHASGDYTISCVKTFMIFCVYLPRSMKLACG